MSIRLLPCKQHEVTNVNVNTPRAVLRAGEMWVKIGRVSFEDRFIFYDKESRHTEAMYLLQAEYVHNTTVYLAPVAIKHQMPWLATKSSVSRLVRIGLLSGNAAVDTTLVKNTLNNTVRARALYSTYDDNTLTMTMYVLVLMMSGMVSNVHYLSCRMRDTDESFASSPIRSTILACRGLTRLTVFHKNTQHTHWSGEAASTSIELLDGL